MSKDKQEGITNATEISDAKELLELMDSVDTIRRQDKEVFNQLSFEDQKKKIKEGLKETYEKMGVRVDEAQLERAFGNYYSKRWEFEPQKETFGSKLAKVYINRGRITRNIILPIIGASSILALTIIGSNQISDSMQRRDERRVEQKIENLYSKRNSLETSLETLNDKKVTIEMPKEESMSFDSACSTAKSQLNETNDFFDEYCPKGSSEVAITLENYRNAENSTNKTIERLQYVEDNLSSAQKIIQKEEQIILIQRDLEGLISKIDEADCHPNIEKKAKEVYEKGKIDLKSRNLESAKQARGDLTEILNDCGNFSGLKEQFSLLYNSSLQIAIENRAISEIEQIKKRTESYIENGDVSNLRTSVNEVQNINQILNQEYNIEVVNKPGLITGLYRHYDGSSADNEDYKDPTGKNFYVVVQAIDKSSGNPIKVRIKSEEDGSVKLVDIWGIRVPHEVYLRVRGDKSDNGLLDGSSKPKGFENRYYAEKKRGYVSLIPFMKDNKGNLLENAGQINSEELNWRSN